MFRIDMSNMQEIKGGSPSSSKAEGRVSVSSDGTDSFEASCNPVGIKVHAPHAAIRITGTDATVAWNLVVPARGEARVSIKAHIENVQYGCRLSRDGMPVEEHPSHRFGHTCAKVGEAVSPRSRRTSHGHPRSSRIMSFLQQELRGSSPYSAEIPSGPQVFMLPLTTRAAMGTLRTLARFQATERDETTNADPGKIMHELRAEPLVSTGASLTGWHVTASAVLRNHRCDASMDNASCKGSRMGSPGRSGRESPSQSSGGAGMVTRLWRLRR